MGAGVRAATSQQKPSLRPNDDSSTRGEVRGPVRSTAEPVPVISSCCPATEAPSGGILPLTRIAPRPVDLAHVRLDVDRRPPSSA